MPPSAESAPRVKAPPKPPPLILPPHYHDVRAILHYAGVGDPKVHQLARLHHATPEYVKAHIAAARRTGHPIGTVIYRIEHNWAVPSEWAGPAEAEVNDGHPPDCQCVWCRVAERRRWSEQDHSTTEEVQA